MGVNAQSDGVLSTQTVEIGYEAPPRADLCSAVSVISQFLALHPVAKLTVSNGDVYIMPLEQGFPITITASCGRDLIVSMGGWHDDIYDWEQAICLVKAALSGKARYIRTTLDGKPWKYDLQCTGVDGKWWSLGEVSYFRFTLWHRETAATMSQYPRLADGPPSYVSYA